MSEEQGKYEYRCTRNAPYMHDCIAHDDVSARQGHYVEGGSVGDALKEMVKSHPEEIEQRFTFQRQLSGLHWDSVPVLRWNWLGFDDTHL